MADGVRRIGLLEAALAGNPHLHVARHPYWKQDPFKVYLTSPHAGGKAISDALAARGVTVEMSDGRGCLLMMPLDGGTRELREAIVAAAHDLAAVTTRDSPPLLLNGASANGTAPFRGVACTTHHQAPL